MDKEELKNILNNLLLISERIYNQEVVLIQFANHSQSLLFQTAIALLCNALNEEKSIIDKLSIDDLKNIESMLFDIEPEEKKKNSYERLHAVIVDMITDYNNENDIGLDDDDINDDTFDDDIEEDTTEYEDDDDEEIDDDEVDDEEVDDDEIIIKSDFYNKNEKYIRKYINPIIRRTTIIVLKKIRSRIINLSNGDINSNMQRLLQYLNKFKYRKVFQDYYLEKLASEYDFNIDSIPTPSLPNEDTSPIMFNRCIDFLDDLYFVDSDEENLEKVMDALFKLMCIEEYIEELSNEELENLLEFCSKAAKQNNNENYGILAENKIRRLLRNNS